MDGVTAYDDDIYAWSREQAALLRRLAETRRDLPNALDLEHVAEEIEDVGKTELRTVESFLELLLRHLVKLASVPDALPARHWRAECILQHRNARKDMRRSMHGRLDLDEIWDAAIKRADAALDEYGDAILPGLPATCPFTLDEFDDAFDVDDATARIKAAAG